MLQLLSKAHISQRQCLPRRDSAGVRTLSSPGNLQQVRSKLDLEDEGTRGEGTWETEDAIRSSGSHRARTCVLEQEDGCAAEVYEFPSCAFQLAYSSSFA